MLSSLVTLKSDEEIDCNKYLLRYLREVMTDTVIYLLKYNMSI